MLARMPGHMLMLVPVMTMHEACQVTWLQQWRVAFLCRGASSTMS